MSETNNSPDPENVRAWVQRGRHYGYLGDFDLAYIYGEGARGEIYNMGEREWVGIRYPLRDRQAQPLERHVHRIRGLREMILEQLKSPKEEFVDKHIDGHGVRHGAGVRPKVGARPRIGKAATAAAKIDRPRIGRR